VIQARNNNWFGWGKTSLVASFVVSCIILVKDVTLLTVFVIRKFLEQRDTATLRPKSYVNTQTVPKLDKESSASMKAYLENTLGESVDPDGNMKLHAMVKHEGSQDLATVLTELEQ